MLRYVVPSLLLVALVACSEDSSNVSSTLPDAQDAAADARGLPDTGNGDRTGDDAPADGGLPDATVDAAKDTGLDLSPIDAQDAAPEGLTPDTGVDVPPPKDVGQDTEKDSAQDLVPDVAAPDLASDVSDTQVVPDVPQVPDVAVDTTPPEPDVPPEVVVPECGDYPLFDKAAFCGQPLPKKVPGIRLLFSFVSVDTDKSTCGKVTWKLANRIVLDGVTPDGMHRGRLTGAEVYYDWDRQFEDDEYVGPDGEVQHFPFIIEVLDDADNVLWRGRRSEPLRVREYVMEALDLYTTYDPVPLMVPMVQTAVNADFQAMSAVVPDLPGATRVRFARDLSAAEKAQAPDCAGTGQLPLPVVLKDGQAPAGLSVAIADIPEVPLQSFLDLAPALEVKRVFGTADTANSLDFVILGDGFAAADKAAFEARAAEVSTFMTQTLEPFKSYLQHINVWSVWAPSTDAGASYDCTCNYWGKPAKVCDQPPGCKEGFKNVMFGSIFTVRALFGLMPLSPPPDAQTDRNLFPLYIFRIAMAQSLTAGDGTPVTGDAAFVITNSPKQGAFGLYNAAASTAYGDVQAGYLAEVATHEMGHAFGVLGDEYNTSTDVCQVFELTALFPNFSLMPATQQDIPWAPWVTLGPPYPNSESQGSASDIGCFVPGPGGGKCCVNDDCGQGYTVCRPTKTCKMKTNTGKFCPVCKDHLIKRIFEYVDILESETFDVTQKNPTTFELSAQLSMTEVQTTWSVDGVVLQTTATFAPFTLDVSTLAAGPHTVTLQVRAAGSDVKVWTESVTETMSVEVTAL